LGEGKIANRSEILSVSGNVRANLEEISKTNLLRLRLSDLLSSTDGVLVHASETVDQLRISLQRCDDINVDPTPRVKNVGLPNKGDSEKKCKWSGIDV